MTLSDFLNFLLTAGGTGAAVFGVLELADKLAGPLTANFKFYASMVLAFALPLVAYAAQVRIEGTQFGLDGLFAAFVVGWLVSQTVHRGTEASG